MLDPTTVKINETIRECIRRCCAAARPLDVLADCLAELKSQPGWTEAGCAQVEAGVRRILAAMLDPDIADSDGDILAGETSG